MKRFSILLSMAVTYLVGCDKSFENFKPSSSSTDTVWASSAPTNLQLINLYNNLQSLPSIDSITIQNGGTFNFPNNVEITIPANAFALNGMPTTGKANIQFYMVTKKGDMIRFCKPTQSNGYLLESGGELYIDASKNGQPLTLIPSKQIKITYPSVAPNPLMKGFIGVEPANQLGPNSVYNWSPSDSIGVRVSVTQTGYQVLSTTLHWINCDYFIDSAATKTTVGLSMPLGFTNTNTLVFIVFKSINGIMQFEADIANKVWLKTKVPINKEAVFVSITKRNDDYWMGTTSATTSTNQHVVIKPVKVKLQDLLNYLAQL